MTRETVLKQLLYQSEKNNPNVYLLKKYLSAIYLGWLRINECPPDKSITLADYIFDDDRIIFDFTRLSQKCRLDFLDWFIKPHEAQAGKSCYSYVSTSNHKGYTTEIELGWIGLISNVLYFRQGCHLWTLQAYTSSSFDYQLNGIEIHESEQGLLIGLQQQCIEKLEKKYQPMINAKRVYFTDATVEELINLNLNSHNYLRILDEPHPYAIDVILDEKRSSEMMQYREVQRFIPTDSWFKWVSQWFEKRPQSSEVSIEMSAQKFGDKSFKTVAWRNKIQVFIRPNNGEVLLIEKRPELDSLVLSGGGSKIYGHVGAYKAFEDASIHFKRFAGSSAGAIMACLAYLGYSAFDIYEFFKNFRQENIVLYDMDKTGISDTRALKAAMDYMIVKKVRQIIEKYRTGETDEGRQFLKKRLFKHGVISFSSLHALKTRYPDCCLGVELVVTATNVDQNKTRYFSWVESPDTEVSLAITMSASFPIMFKPMLYEGETHNDGGILSNLPTEVFSDNGRTLLQSGRGNCLSLVVFQFDNGMERGALDTLVDRVYRENFVLNWLYGYITGVSDPVSGWEKDRLKLVQHSHQVVLIPVGNVTATQFDMDADIQEKLFQNGYDAGKNYIKARYEQISEEGEAENEEYLYSTFSSVEEVMYYSAFRGREDWFDYFADLSQKQGVDAEKISLLKQRHFGKKIFESMPDIILKKSQFEKEILALYEKKNTLKNMLLFEGLYPVFLKLPAVFFRNPQDFKIFKSARHCLSLYSSFQSLEYLLKINGECHLFVRMLQQILNDYKKLDIGVETAFIQLSMIQRLYKEPEILQNEFYGNWPLLQRHTKRLLHAMITGQWSVASELCIYLRNRIEPMQTFFKGYTCIVEDVEEAAITKNTFSFN